MREETALSVKAMLSVEHVNKWHGGLHALREVCLTVAPGECVAVCGPSGSGKSTLLRCINALDSHQSGQISVAGREITLESGVREAIRRDVGMVFQALNLFPHLTALQNCTLAPLSTRRMNPVAAESLAREFLARVQVENLADRYPSQLSGGQQQRVAIARALCMRPKMLLFDEPTSALDPEMIGEVLDTISELADSGMTMLCVTHQINFARQLADRIVFMDHGEVVEQGAPKDVIDNPKTARLKAFLSRTLRGPSSAD